MKSTLYLLVILLSLSSFTLAIADDYATLGQTKIDSLISELSSAKEDTVKVNILYNISFELKGTNPQLGLDYALRGVKIARKINWKSGEADCLFCIGLLYDYLSDYLESLKYYNYSLKIRKDINDLKGVAHCYRNIGLLYSYTDDFDKALEFSNKGLKISTNIDDEMGKANAFENIGIVYLKKNEYKKALEYYTQSLDIGEKNNDKVLMASCLSDMGLILNNLGEHKKALENYQTALELFLEMNHTIGIIRTKRRLGALYLESYFNGDKTEINHPIGSGDISTYKKGIEYLEGVIPMLIKLGDIHMRARTLESLSDAYEKKGDYKNAFYAHKQHKILIDSVFSQEKASELQKFENERKNLEKDREIQFLNEREKASKRERDIIITASIIGFLMIFIVVLIILRQRKRSENLLLSILPAVIAKRLKKKERPIADHFSDVSIIFIDIVGFTNLSSDANPERIVEVLDNIFIQFDAIANKYNIEKIKTIGDCYMAVSGIPLPDSNHANNMADFALEVSEAMSDYRIEDNTFIQFRIGIACGEVVAGVIGNNKFIYDLWGDTVNTASRMESSCIPDRIHVTEKFRDALEGDYRFEERGNLEIKGKGIMKTYFLEKRNILVK